MNILIRPNIQKLHIQEIFTNTIEYMLKLCLCPMISYSDSKIFAVPRGCKVDHLENLLDATDLIVSIGGDGTLLDELSNVIRADCPIMGINAGRVGFLTQFDGEELHYLDRIKSGDYTISKRMLIEVEISKQNGKTQTFIALNDIVFRRISIESSILNLSVCHNDGLIFKQNADGLIFATPTGSTAYSLSAGGPIAVPEVQAIILTPICPHNMFRSSIILSTEGEYKITESEISRSGEQGIYIGIDGKWLCNIKKGESAVIKKSDIFVNFIELGIRNFHKKLNDKLHYL